MGPGMPCMCAKDSSGLCPEHDYDYEPDTATTIQERFRAQHNQDIRPTPWPLEGHTINEDNQDEYDTESVDSDMTECEYTMCWVCGHYTYSETNQLCGKTQCNHSSLLPYGHSPTESDDDTKSEVIDLTTEISRKKENQAVVTQHLPPPLPPPHSPAKRPAKRPRMRYELKGTLDGPFWNQATQYGLNGAYWN